MGRTLFLPTKKNHKFKPSKYRSIKYTIQFVFHGSVNGGFSHTYPPQKPYIFLHFLWDLKGISGSFPSVSLRHPSWRLRSLPRLLGTAPFFCDLTPRQRQEAAELMMLQVASGPKGLRRRLAGWIHGASALEVVVPRHHFLDPKMVGFLFLVDEFLTPH